MASTPRPAMSTASAAFQPAPMSGRETPPSTSATENIGPMARAWATAWIVPSRRSPSCPVLPLAISAMTESLLGRMKSWIHSHPGWTASRQAAYCMQKPMSAPSSTAGPLQIQSVVDQVYAAVRARILAGELPRGSRLRQAALADELGVSRTPLREALRRLATEGLVELEANRGATVAEHDFADQRQSWLARRALEPGAARLAAERCDEGGIAAMRAAIEAQRDAGGDPAASYDVNRGFHLALV